MVPQSDGGFFRLKGGLLPTRCFGDVSYNRTEEERERLATQLRAVDPRPRKTKMTSAPYLDWTPEMSVRDAADLRFLVLATDGGESSFFFLGCSMQQRADGGLVWDRMTSKEAALGVIAHAQAPVRADVPWPALERTLPGGLEVLDPKFPSDEMSGYEEGAWVFEDASAATCIIKNALCGGDRGLLRQMLSLCNGTRAFRDDMTAM